MKLYVRPKGWQRWQQPARPGAKNYSATPKWFRVYHAVLRDREWRALSVAGRLLLFVVWNLTADMGLGNVPADPEWLADIGHLPTVDLAELVQSELVALTTADGTPVQDMPTTLWGHPVQGGSPDHLYHNGHAAHVIRLAEEVVDRGGDIPDIGEVEQRLAGALRDAPGADSGENPVLATWVTDVTHRGNGVSHRANKDSYLQEVLTDPGETPGRPRGDPGETPGQSRVEESREEKTSKTSVEHAAPPGSVSPVANGAAQGATAKREAKAAKQEARATLWAPEVGMVWDRYLRHHPRARLGGKSRGLITDRIEEGYTVEDLRQAIDGCHGSAWHMGRNDRRRPFNALSLILRNSDKVQGFIELYERQQAPGGGGQGPVSRAEEIFRQAVAERAKEEQDVEVEREAVGRATGRGLPQGG